MTTTFNSTTRMSSSLVIDNTPLPFIWTFPYSRRTMLVENLTKDRFDEVYQLVNDAALRGDNIGSDEFPTSEDFKERVRHSTTLTFSDLTTKKLESLITISPCRYVRSYQPTLCSVLVVTSERMANKMMWRELVQFAQVVVLELPEGYSACLVDVFISCLDRMLAMREEGFVITACVPEAGKLTGSDMYIGNYLMYKELGVGDRPKLFTIDDNHEILGAHSPNLLDYPFLPATRRLSDGTQVTMRSLRQDEIHSFYHAVRESIESNAGYGLDELPNISYFAKNYLNNFFNAVYQMESTGQIIAYGNWGPSTFSRSAKPKITDGNLVILPEFRGRGWFRELFGMNFAVNAEAGVFASVQGETSAVSLANIMGSMHMGYTINGVLPKGIYFKDHGWMDLIMYYMPASLQHTIADAFMNRTRNKPGTINSTPTSKI